MYNVYTFDVAYTLLLLYLKFLLLINYFISRGNNLFLNLNLIYGLTAILIGIIAMVYIPVIGSVFRIIIGVWIIYTSIIRINTAFKIRSFGNIFSTGSSILAIIMFFCGIYVIITPGTIIATIGAIMIIYSIIDIIENLIFIKNINKTL